MKKEIKIIEIPVEDLLISPLYEEVFSHFERDRDNLYERISFTGYNPFSRLKVRKAKGRRNEFEIICGVGRFEILKRFAEESKYPITTSPKVNCELVDPDDDENCLKMLLNENIDTKNSFTGFSDLQFLTLVKLANKLSKNQISRRFIKAHSGIEETTYVRLNQSYRFIINRIREEYPDCVNQLKEQAKENKLTEILLELKLINYVLDKNSWKDLAEFFAGKMAINKFHSQCFKNAPKILEDEIAADEKPGARSKPKRRVKEESIAEETIASPENNLTVLEWIDETNEALETFLERFRAGETADDPLADKDAQKRLMKNAKKLYELVKPKKSKKVSKEKTDENAESKPDARPAEFQQSNLFEPREN